LSHYPRRTTCLGAIQGIHPKQPPMPPGIKPECLPLSASRVCLVVGVFSAIQGIHPKQPPTTVRHRTCLLLSARWMCLPYFSEIALESFFLN